MSRGGGVTTLRAALPGMLDSGAVFDTTRFYRYALWRTWDDRRTALACVLLNPSTADERTLDPTVRRCLYMAQRRGFGSLRVVNIFAYRSTDPDALRRVDDPVGPANDRYIRAAVARAERVLAAWGNGGLLMDRGRRVRALLRGCRNLCCLGMTKAGEPRHPLYVPNGAVLRAFAEEGAA